MNLVEIVRDEASKRLGSEAEVEAFVEGFQKQAAFSLTKLLRNRTVQEAAIKAGFGLMAGLAGAGIAKGISTANEAVVSNTLHSKFESALSWVMQNNKIVKAADPVKAKSYANTMFHFAPHVAADQNMLSSLLANSVLGEGVDSTTIAQLSQLEGRYRDNNSQKPFISIRG